MGISKEKITTITTTVFLPDSQKNLQLSLTQDLPKLRRKKERVEIGNPKLRLGSVRIGGSRRSLHGRTTLSLSRPLMRVA